jgi:hypothetical protein
MNLCSALLWHAGVVVRGEISVHAAVGLGWHAVERSADAFDVISRNKTDFRFSVHSVAD